MTHPLHDIAIGTLIKGNSADPAAAIRHLLPYGFETFQLFFWKNLGGHELPRLAGQVRTALAGSPARISSLGVFGNPLADDEDGRIALAAWETAIDHAGDFGCDLVCGFTGRVRGVSIPDSIPRFREVFGRLADRAAARQVRIGFENCAMGGDWKAGDWNLAHGPDAWELLFAALPAAHLGLEWEPCHQQVALREPLPQLDDWQERIFHIHGKDATIDRHRLARHGIGGKTPWCWHRTPGFGDSDWTAIISRLRLNGFKGAIDIEGWHDPVYRGELEYCGQVQALRHLQACRGGNEVVPPPPG